MRNPKHQVSCNPQDRLTVKLTRCSFESEDEPTGPGLFDKRHTPLEAYYQNAQTDQA